MLSSVEIVTMSKWDNLLCEHQQYPLLGLKLGYMYWGQNEYYQKNYTYQYIQKKEVHVLMYYFILVHRQEKDTLNYSLFHVRSYFRA